MKKFLDIILTFSLAFAMTSCGNSEQEVISENTETISESKISGTVVSKKEESNAFTSLCDLSESERYSLNSARCVFNEDNSFSILADIAMYQSSEVIDKNRYAGVLSVQGADGNFRVSHSAENRRPRFVNRQSGYGQTGISRYMFALS